VGVVVPALPDEVEVEPSETLQPATRTTIVTNATRAITKDNRESRLFMPILQDPYGNTAPPDNTLRGVRNP
jgi:hypothetical protein